MTEVHGSCSVCSTGGSLYTTRGKYEIFRCDGCNLLFTHPLPPPDVIEDQYDQGDEEAGEEYVRQGSLMRRLRYGWRARRLKRLGMKGSLLEIGCGQGDLLVAARGAGFSPLVGVEPNKNKARYGQGLGFDVRPIFFEKGSFGNDRFDVIVALQVIEHVPDPVQFVLDAAELLTKEGRLVLETPCTSHPRARRAGTAWRYMCPPWHLNLFDEKSLGELFSRGGLELERTWQHRRKAYITGVGRRPPKGPVPERALPSS